MSAVHLRQPAWLADEQHNKLRKKQKHAEQKEEDSSNKVMYRTMQCCVLNAVVFGLSLLFFENALLPGLGVMMGYLLGNGEEDGRMWMYVQPMLSALFNMFWVLPIFALSRLINTIWFQANLLRMVPLVGANVILSGLHMCMLQSLYPFEYRWLNMGWELYKRLSCIEVNWPYFIGFGLPMTVITMYPSSMYISGCFFSSLLFPIFIISANEAEPVPNPRTLPLPHTCTERPV